MKLRMFVVISILFMLFAGAHDADGDRTIQHVQKTTITIQASDPGKPISPDLFGIFFEDLNYAADGGLYAELIQNRSFEYSPTEQSYIEILVNAHLEKKVLGYVETLVPQEKLNIENYWSYCGQSETECLEHLRFATVISPAVFLMAKR